VGVYRKNVNLANPPVNALIVVVNWKKRDVVADTHGDFDIWLEKLAPHSPTEQDNADAHLKRQIMGREVVVGITNGKLNFGPWEQIF